MAFLVTGLYGLVLFGLGMYFARRERKERAERADKEEHPVRHWSGEERRSGHDRRHDAVLTH